MIKKIEDDMVVDCINLMYKSFQDNDYCPTVGNNHRVWIEKLNDHVYHAGKDDPHWLAIGDYSEDGTLKGFMLASTYNCFYSNDVVMDVKDCIVDHDHMNAFTVARLFDHMIDHVQRHGGKYWRADSIRAGDKAVEYTEFLRKKYNARPFHGVHGTV